MLQRANVQQTEKQQLQLQENLIVANESFNLIK